jgi:hypothetical protein
MSLEYGINIELRGKRSTETQINYTKISTALTVDNK